MHGSWAPLSLELDMPAGGLRGTSRSLHTARSDTGGWMDGGVSVAVNGAVTRVEVFEFLKQNLVLENAQSTDRFDGSNRRIESTDLLPP